MTFNTFLLVVCGVFVVLVKPIFAIEIKSEGTNFTEPKFYSDIIFETIENSGPYSCGGVSRVDNVRIIYKPFESLQSNERCVWIIASTNGVNSSTSYKIRPVNLGFPASELMLSFATLTRRDAAVSLGYPVKEGTMMEMLGNTLVITFTSPNNITKSSGFILEITSHNYEASVDPGSRYELLNPNDYFHKHPSKNENYLNSEHSILTFLPTTSTFTHFNKQIILCREIFLEETFDWIGIYFFEASTASWKFKGRLMGGFKVGKISHDDIIMIVFNSDGSNVGGGFELTSIAT